MRRDLMPAALLLALSGCDLSASGPYDYAQPAYPPGYPQAGYPAADYGPYGNVYPGYSDIGGNPTLLIEGAPRPLTLYGGSWGYWDSHHSWHRAPDEVSRHLEEQRGPGGGFRHDGEDFDRSRRQSSPPRFDDHDRERGFAHGNEQPRPMPPPGAPGGRPPGAYRGPGFHSAEQGRPVAAPAPHLAPPPAANFGHPAEQARPVPLQGAAARASGQAHERQ